MTFRIYHTVPYYAQSAHDLVPRTQDEWYAYKFCGAVKNRTINGSLTLPNSGNINEKNVGNARAVFGRLIIKTLKDEGLTGAYLVPVPSKDSFSVKEFRSLAMLRESVPSYSTQLLPIVRFKAKLEKASAGGDRGYWSVYPHLKVEASPPRTIVLIDDILTSGGTMLAVRRKLIEAGHDVRLGIVCGRTTHEKIKPVFKRVFEDIDDNATSVPFLVA